MIAIRVTAYAAFLGALAAYGLGAMHSPLANGGEAERAAMLRAVAKGAEIDMVAEEALARAYWSRNPDVAADAMYGERGRLGVLGAREHFLRHGRNEGRPWGL